MFFPVSKNTKCLKMKNFHKQNFPLHARSGEGFVLQRRHWKGEKGLWICSDFSSAFGEENQIPAGPEAGSTRRLRDHVPASDPLLRELLLRGHVRSPKATVGKGGKRCRARPWAETLVKGYVTPPRKGPPRADARRSTATEVPEAG